MVQSYGTPRCFPCSQVSSRSLTKRNYRELPTSLLFDEQHREAVGVEWQSRVVASPAIVEWIMGLPRGWTATEALCKEAVKSHVLGGAMSVGISAAAGSAMAVGVSAAADSAKLSHTLSLFTGCGGLDWGLLDRCRPVAYCESCTAAAAVLRARMSDGSLPPAPLHPDVCNLHGADIGSEVDGIVMVFRARTSPSQGRGEGLVAGGAPLCSKPSALLTKPAALSYSWKTLRI